MTKPYTHERLPTIGDMVYVKYPDGGTLAKVIEVDGKDATEFVRVEVGNVNPWIHKHRGEEVYPASREYLKIIEEFFTNG
jgi:hypothetical protein